MLQAMNGPQTPQTAAPAPALRFGDFEESTVASGFASAPRAAPPSQVNPPCPHCQISPTKHPSAALLVSILAGPCAAAQGRQQKRTTCSITSLHARTSAVTPCHPPPSGPSLAAMHTIGMSVQAPPAQQPPPLAPRVHSSAPGQPRAQQQPAQPAPPSHMSAPPQQQQQMGQPQRPPLIATPALR